MIVKKENDLDENPFLTVTVPILDLGTQVEQLVEEKAKLVADLVDMKRESQKLHHDMDQKTKRCDKLKQETISLKSQMKMQLDDCNKELSDLKQKYSNVLIEKLHCDRKNVILMRDTQVLNAHLVQLQQSTQSNVLDKSDDANLSVDSVDGEYEVEALLDHKIVKGTWKFLVRWKHFSNEHDLWLNEKKLMCPTILTDYLKKQIRK